MKRIDGIDPNRYGIKYDLPPVEKRPNPDTIASADRWILCLPGDHPGWDHYMVSGCMLRDFPGVPPAAKQFPEATHEIVVAAIDPKFPKKSLEEGGVQLLDPLNYVQQVTTDDATFNKLLEHLVVLFINGEIPAEPQGMSINGMSAREFFRQVAEEFLNV